MGTLLHLNWSFQDHFCLVLSLICEMLPLKLLYQNTAFKSSTQYYLLGKVTQGTLVIRKLNTFFYSLYVLFYSLQSWCSDFQPCKSFTSSLLSSRWAAAWHSTKSACWHAQKCRATVSLVGLAGRMSLSQYTCAGGKLRYWRKHLVTTTKGDNMHSFSLLVFGPLSVVLLGHIQAYCLRVS